MSLRKKYTHDLWFCPRKKFNTHFALFSLLPWCYLAKQHHGLLWCVNMNVTYWWHLSFEFWENLFKQLSHTYQPLPYGATNVLVFNEIFWSIGIFSAHILKIYCMFHQHLCIPYIICSFVCEGHFSRLSHVCVSVCVCLRPQKLAFQSACSHSVSLIDPVV